MSVSLNRTPYLRLCGRYSMGLSSSSLKFSYFALVPGWKKKGSIGLLSEVSSEKLYSPLLLGIIYNFIIKSRYNGRLTLIYIFILTNGIRKFFHLPPSGSAPRSHYFRLTIFGSPSCSSSASILLVAVRFSLPSISSFRISSTTICAWTKGHRHSRLPFLAPTPWSRSQLNHLLPCSFSSFSTLFDFKSSNGIHHHFRPEDSRISDRPRWCCYGCGLLPLDCYNWRFSRVIPSGTRIKL